MMLVSVCGTHRPDWAPAELAPGEAVHLTKAEVAAARASAAEHIGQCSRGPITSIPVHVINES